MPINQLCCYGLMFSAVCNRYKNTYNPSPFTVVTVSLYSTEGSTRSHQKVIKLRTRDWNYRVQKAQRHTIAIICAFIPTRSNVYAWLGLPTQFAHRRHKSCINSTPSATNKPTHKNKKQLSYETRIEMSYFVRWKVGSVLYFHCFAHHRAVRKALVRIISIFRFSVW